MRGAFLVYGYYGNIDDSSIGVNKKIQDQINVLNKNGIICDIRKINNKSTSFFRIKYRLPFTNVFPEWKYDTYFDNLDFLYFRRPLYMNGAMRNFLKKIKKNNCKVKILLEIPTYPYDKEILTSWKYFTIYIMDKCSRRKLDGIVDKIVTLSDDDKLWGIDTLKIDNGLYLENYSAKKATLNNDINIVAVAQFKEWHGYERVLNGMKTYYEKNGKRKVIFHLVGNGSEVEKYKRIVKEGGLEDCVIFYGQMKKEDIDDIYDKCDIGMCSFGGYKKNLFLSKELKSREYMAKGLPIVTGCKISGIEEGYPYCMEISNDNSEVDIQKVIDFYDKIHFHKSKECVIREIRSYAEDHITMDSAMSAVVEYINGL